jgi:hypothetical protein
MFHETGSLGRKSGIRISETIERGREIIIIIIIIIMFICPTVLEEPITEQK